MYINKGRAEMVDSFQSAVDFLKDIRKSARSVGVKKLTYRTCLATGENVHKQITVFTYLPTYYSFICTFSHSNWKTIQEYTRN